MAKVTTNLKKALVIFIKTYQYIVSPWVGQHCRFYPTCSQYAIEALEKHGCLKGGWYIVSRLCRCHPLCKGGVDLVP